MPQSNTIKPRLKFPNCLQILYPLPSPQPVQPGARRGAFALKGRLVGAEGEGEGAVQAALVTLSSG